MPSKGHTVPDALPLRIREHLAQHPGEEFRARDIANALGLPDGMTQAKWSQKVANALTREVNRQTVIREYRDLGHKNPTGVYSAAPTTGDTTP